MGDPTAGWLDLGFYFVWESFSSTDWFLCFASGSGHLLLPLLRSYQRCHSQSQTEVTNDVAQRFTDSLNHPIVLSACSLPLRHSCYSYPCCCCYSGAASPTTPLLHREPVNVVAQLFSNSLNQCWIPSKQTQRLRKRKCREILLLLMKKMIATTWSTRTRESLRLHIPRSVSKMSLLESRVSISTSDSKRGTFSLFFLSPFCSSSLPPMYTLSSPPQAVNSLPSISIRSLIEWRNPNCKLFISYGNSN